MCCSRTRTADFVSEYVTGATDTLGKFETVTLIDCAEV